MFVFLVVVILIIIIDINLSLEKHYMTLTSPKGCTMDGTHKKQMVMATYELNQLREA